MKQEKEIDVIQFLKETDWPMVVIILTLGAGFFLGGYMFGYGAAYNNVTSFYSEHIQPDNCLQIKPESKNPYDEITKDLEDINWTIITS